MERSVYERMQEVEATHWWFVSRRKVIAALVGDLLKACPDARILDAGCGSGGNLRMLAQFGEVDAFEYDSAAREHAVAQSGLDIRFGALPDTLPFDDRHYDLIGLFDVLEHVEQDTASLQALACKLKTGGRMLVTVPAFPILWSLHDERHHHFRRYTRASLEKAARNAGLTVSYSTYFNTLLFPAAVLTRALKRVSGNHDPDDQLPPAWLNRLLTRVFGLEGRVLRVVRFPVGLSLAAVLEKG